MKLTLFLLVAIWSGILPGEAKEFRLPADKPVASIDIPDQWHPNVIQKGLQTETTDHAVYLSIETTATPDEMTAVIDQTDAMFKSHKVTLDKGRMKDRKFTLNGLPAEELVYTGRDEDGPALIRITFVTVGKAAVVFTYWASVEGNQKHRPELDRILSSLKPVTR